MRAPLTLLALFALFVLPACGDDAPPSGPGAQGSGMKVQVDGRTYDVGSMQEAGKRMQDLQSRALTPADVERYIALMQEVKRLGNDQDAWAKAVAARGGDLIEISALSARIGSAYAALRLAPDALDEKAKADAAVVRPFLERIEAATK